ncbi:hypothetical protein HMPREF9371_1642 [Neisseria shayeganii 871]|uniref:Uncharacterized protein n=1 Tax=Neisseria shayeganii 871 TaxID=1032488 RepID=G4CJ53_9NEIS|nr:hypothetical protein HMPREF9371_1642 [Neisseria shayeganii 871]
MKQEILEKVGCTCGQPPTGGCVLKHFLRFKIHIRHDSAAHGRLRVETAGEQIDWANIQISRPRAAAC